jgi:hypothetical protein
MNSSNITAAVADANYDFHNLKARGLHGIVKVSQDCVGIGPDNGLYKIQSGSDMRAFKLNSDIPTQYSGTHKHCLVRTQHGLRHYLIPNSVVRSSYSKTLDGKPATLKGSFDGLNGDSNLAPYELWIQIIDLMKYMDAESGFHNNKPCKMPFQNKAWVFALSSLTKNASEYKGNWPLQVAKRIILYIQSIKQGRFRFKSQTEMKKEIDSAWNYVSDLKSLYNIHIQLPDQPLSLRSSQMFGSFDGLNGDADSQFSLTTVAIVGVATLATGIGLGYILRRK